MIPALLTCVYVVYLYRTLNQVQATTSDATENSHADGATLDQLTQRLQALDARLAALADPTSRGRIDS